MLIKDNREKNNALKQYECLSKILNLKAMTLRKMQMF